MNHINKCTNMYCQVIILIGAENIAKVLSDCINSSAFAYVVLKYSAKSFADIRPRW